MLNPLGLNLTPTRATQNYMQSIPIARKYTLGMHIVN